MPTKTQSRSKTTNGAFAEIVLQNGQRFEVKETFATVLRHQKEILEKDEPLMTLTGPSGTRIAMDPIEIISVNEIVRPTRQSARSNGAGSKPAPAAKKQTAAKKEPATTRRSARVAGRRSRRAVAA